VRRGGLGSNQKVGGCAESDRMEALGCQRIMWAVHTESTNNTELRPVKRGIGLKGRPCGMMGLVLSYPNLAATAGRPGGFVPPPEKPSRS
jgi:hypothetical protein